MKEALEEISKIPGWFFSEEFFVDYISHCPVDAKIVEVGCFFGASSMFIGYLAKKNKKQIHLSCVDVWESCFYGAKDLAPFYSSDESKISLLNQEYKRLVEKFGNDNPYAIFDFYMKRFKLEKYITPFKMTSLEASRHFNPGELDLVFLDGDHEFESVLQDIIVWKDKIKKGGIIAGDDYHSKKVRLAVDKVFGNVQTWKIKNHETLSSVWFVKC